MTVLPISRSLPALVAATLMTLGGCSGGTEPSDVELRGVWGGPGMHLVVSDRAATAAFDCGSGQIPSPIHLDAAGRFAVSGTVTRSVGWATNTWPARYEGAWNHNVLTVRIAVDVGAPDGVADPWGPFVLREGETPLLTVCR